MKEILKKTPNAKVLFVSAEKRVEKDALEAGAIGFFTKPTSIRTLLAEIDRIQKLQTEKLKAGPQEFSIKESDWKVE